MPSLDKVGIVLCILRGQVDAMGKSAAKMRGGRGGRNEDDASDEHHRGGSGEGEKHLYMKNKLHMK